MKYYSVLIIDDSRTRCLVIRRFLENNFEVHTALDGHAGIEIFKKHRPNCVLLDIHLPDCNGYDLCKKIKKSEYGANVVIILVSATRSPQDMALGFLYGCNDFLTVPISKSNLISRIHFHLTLNRHNNWGP